MTGGARRSAWGTGAGIVLLAGVLLGGCVPMQVPERAEAPPAPVPPVASAPRPAPQPAPAPRPSGASPAPAPAPGSGATGPLPRSRYGNPPFYEVFGRRYFVLDDSSGYREDGVASWYGKQFHGKRTSSGEVYDMHAYTAAHKTLPLPSIVRVTNLDNGQSVVVTVNDRGPFVKDRLIDLSFAAAEDLGIVKAGTGRVQVEAINGAGSGPVVGQGPTRGASPVPGQPAELMYMQVGAFGDRDNAARMKGSLESSGLSNVVIRYDVAANPALYHVRIGPLADSAEYDALARRMASLSITNPRLVTESAAAGQMAD